MASVIVIAPITRRPDIALAWTNRLRVNHQWRWSDRDRKEDLSGSDRRCRGNRHENCHEKRGEQKPGPDSERAERTANIESVHLRHLVRTSSRARKPFAKKALREKRRQKQRRPKSYAP